MNLRNISLEQGYQFLLVALAVSLSLPERVAPLVIIALVLVSVALRVKHKIGLKYQPIVAYLFFAIFVYYSIRLFGSHNVHVGIKFIEKNLAFVALPLAILPNFIKHVNSVYKGFILGFSAVAVFTMFFCGVDYLFFNSENRWYFQNIEDYGFHPTYMGLYAIISIVILDRNKIFRKKVNLLLISINILFIIFSASRIALLALIVLFVYRAIFFRKKEYIIALIVSCIVSVSFYFISNDFQYKINQLATFKGLNHYDNNDYGSVSVRVAKIIAAKNVWKENVWFGYGTGGLNDELNKQYRSKAIECWPCSQRKYNPHNQYLSILAGHGILGFVLFLLLIGYIAYHAIKNKDYMVLEFILAFLVFGLTESILERQKGILLFTFLCFYSFTTMKHPEKNKSIN